MTANAGTQRPRIGDWLALAAFAAAVIAVAAIGAIAVGGTAEQYNSLAQPSWAPPSWLFGPVWTVLYVMIALSGWLAWRKGASALVLTVYAAQLVLNAIWTPLFFGANRYGLAFADIVVLWILIVVTMVLFSRLSKLAAWLLAPYLLWVTFAAALNFSVWQLNT
ncbi:TspO/MBR family protein [Catelliglobosispora koreensis]|uniref:TspO/MBR family protein n=1 Tax=Catelliglobosispora koreensis TaxID=129052 RepID=UPI00035C17B6|nr:TspO/MBR family protein [Catelliglobosispora koreensis]